jgi:hypothetical protein
METEMTIRRRIAFLILTHRTYLLPDFICMPLLKRAFANSPIDFTPASITPASEPGFVIMRVDDTQPAIH